jgi:hypothetical protein
MVDSFSLDVKKFADAFEDGAEQAVRGTAISLFAAIIKDTPVDKGRARANWFATGQLPSSRSTEAVDTSKDGENTAFKMATIIDSLKNHTVLTLTNNLDYIEGLEFGHSKQSPQGMVRINITNFNSLLEAESKRSLPR